MEKKRRYPIGSEYSKKGVSFRLWAPDHSQVALFLENSEKRILMTREPNGYFSAFVPLLPQNALYWFELHNNDRENEQDQRQKEKKWNKYPDPASHYQPYGVEGPSCVVNHEFSWTDQQWSGKEISDQIAYEMHIGTFTQEGTFKAAAQQLESLAELGITIIEMMPVNEFPGKFGWGYDGVGLFAPYHHYGTPKDLKSFINKAHRLNMAVILDVVYNHFGPEGNYLTKFSSHYMHSAEITEWGDAINFDHPDCRIFFLTNAEYWIEEFHFDGLRVDAMHAYVCETTPHFFADLTDIVQQARPTQKKIIVGENDKQEAICLKPNHEQGYEFDALWNDDFHHTALVRLKGKREGYYSDFLGTPQEFLSSLKHGFLYQGQYYSWLKKNRGTLQLSFSKKSRMIFLENHDQIASTSTGRRLHQLCDPGNYRAMTALLLLGPNVPLLFQGQEFGSTSPFNYFADHNRELNKLIYKGRKKSLAIFPHIKSKETYTAIKNPSDPSTFLECKLDHSKSGKNIQLYKLHKDLIYLRRNDPVLKYASKVNFDGAILNQDAFIIRFFDDSYGDRLLIINFGTDFTFNPAPEPLLATNEDQEWAFFWSSDSLDYGGEGISPLTKPYMNLSGHSALLLKISINEK
jgi:maltooligosyltrehalose trehalohydrolase